MSRLKLPSTQKQTLQRKYAHYLASEGHVRTSSSNTYNLFASANKVDKAWIVIAKDFLARNSELLLSKS